MIHTRKMKKKLKKLHQELGYITAEISRGAFFLEEEQKELIKRINILNDVVEFL